MLYFLTFITLILDYLISYSLNITFNNLSIFYPMLTLTLIIFLYHKLPNKYYLKYTFIIGFIYDLLFSYIFILNALIFLLFAKILKKINKYLRYNLLINLILLIIFIFLYDLILFLLVKITNYNLVSLSDLLNKFLNSLVLNISFYLILTIIFKKVKTIKH